MKPRLTLLLRDCAANARHGRMRLSRLLKNRPNWAGIGGIFAKELAQTYTNMIAKNRPKILTEGTKLLVRGGGLIDYIEKNKGTSDATATLNGCKGRNGEHCGLISYGGL